jgi:hypothetical protein
LGSNVTDRKSTPHFSIPKSIRLSWRQGSAIIEAAYVKPAEQFRHQGQSLARCRYGFSSNVALNEPCRLNPKHAVNLLCRSSRLCAGIAQVGFAAAPKDGRDALLDAGRKQIESHLVGAKFRREEMKTASAKVALLTTALRVGTPPAFAALRYHDTKLASLKDAKFDAAFSAVDKLKPIPEAMWFWAEALRLRGVKS